LNQIHKPIQKLEEVWGAQRGHRARVLLYHSISDSSGDPFSVSPELFRNQMKWLHENGFRVISSQELLYAIQQPLNLSRTVVITFDDALCDFFDTAIPILHEFHFPAAVFVPTGRIGQVGDWGRASPNRQLMDEQQLILAARLGFELGSHTVNHASLPGLSQVALTDELQQSLAYLIKLTGQNRIPLAYPYGSGGVREQTAAHSTGYTCAYLAGGVWGVGRDSNLFALPREVIHYKTSVHEFSMIVAGKMFFRRAWSSLQKKVLPA
jgi:peptidoglycan/xylan/chitin deacetylase (PgdA/CDA1 family)